MLPSQRSPPPLAPKPDFPNLDPFAGKWTGPRRGRLGEQQRQYPATDGRARTNASRGNGRPPCDAGIAVPMSRRASEDRSRRARNRYRTDGPCVRTQFRRLLPGQSERDSCTAVPPRCNKPTNARSRPPALSPRTKPDSLVPAPKAAARECPKSSQRDNAANQAPRARNASQSISASSALAGAARGRTEKRVTGRIRERSTREYEQRSAARAVLMVRRTCWPARGEPRYGRHLDRQLVELELSAPDGRWLPGTSLDGGRRCAWSWRDAVERGPRSGAFCGHEQGRDWLEVTRHRPQRRGRGQGFRPCRWWRGRRANAAPARRCHRRA